MEENYIRALVESLEKKSEILSEIILKNEEQKQILEADLFVIADFDRTIDEKSILIKQLMKMDAGFQIVYDKIKRELEDQKNLYKDEITRMKELIQQITDKSVRIQTEETRNKTLVEQYFKRERGTKQLNRITSKAALKYYKNMSRTNLIDPQFMDKKK